jgi:hypothetical protein
MNETRKMIPAMLVQNFEIRPCMDAPPTFTLSKGDVIHVDADMHASDSKVVLAVGPTGRQFPMAKLAYRVAS